MASSYVTVDHKRGIRNRVNSIANGKCASTYANFLEAAIKYRGKSRHDTNSNPPHLNPKIAKQNRCKKSSSDLLILPISKATQSSGYNSQPKSTRTKTKCEFNQLEEQVRQECLRRLLESCLNQNLTESEAEKMLSNINGDQKQIKDHADSCDMKKEETFGSKNANETWHKERQPTKAEPKSKSRPLDAAIDEKLKNNTHGINATSTTTGFSETTYHFVMSLTSGYDGEDFKGIGLRPTTVVFNDERGPITNDPVYNSDLTNSEYRAFIPPTADEIQSENQFQDSLKQAVALWDEGNEEAGIDTESSQRTDPRKTMTTNSDKMNEMQILALEMNIHRLIEPFIEQWQQTRKADNCSQAEADHLIDAIMMELDTAAPQSLVNLGIFPDQKAAKRRQKEKLEVEKQLHSHTAAARAIKSVSTTSQLCHSQKISESEAAAFESTPLRCERSHEGMRAIVKTSHLQVESVRRMDDATRHSVSSGVSSLSPQSCSFSGPHNELS